MSTVNSTHEPRNGIIRAEKSRWPLVCVVSSKITPGERCNWLTITRSAPLITKVPNSVSSGNSPRKTSFSIISLIFFLLPTVSLEIRRRVAFSGMA